MRGVDLDLFDFDYDLTWMGFFLDANGTIHGRYGGRDAASAESRVSLRGLRYALEAALERHRQARLRCTQTGEGEEKEKQPRTVERYPAVRRLPERACIHCHQVYDLRRESLQAKGKWRLDDLWVYPLPENIGLTLECDRGDFVSRVAADSPAHRIGVRAGDRLREVNGESISSFADLQYVLHRAPAKGTLALSWLHGEKTRKEELTLAEGWKKTDLSWRWSLRGVDPPPWVRGDDLTDTEKKKMGLGPRQLAFRQGPFVSEPARQAGIRQNDIVVGVDGKKLELSERQFGAYIRLNYRVGDRVTYNILREGKRVDIPLLLRGRTAP